MRSYPHTRSIRRSQGHESEWSEHCLCLVCWLLGRRKLWWAVLAKAFIGSVGLTILVAGTSRAFVQWG
jgi:hypothetical protein